MNPHFPGSRFQSVAWFFTYGRGNPLLVMQNNGQTLPFHGRCNYCGLYNLTNCCRQRNLVQSQIPGGSQRPHCFGNFNHQFQFQAQLQQRTQQMFQFHLAHQMMQHMCLSSSRRDTRITENSSPYRNASDSERRSCENHYKNRNLSEKNNQGYISAHSSKNMGWNGHNERSARPRIKEWTKNIRAWRYVKQKGMIPSGGMDISVMSYNVLSQALLEDHQYLYQECCDEDLNWSVRGPAIMEQIQHHKSDIVCLQEVQKDHWETFIKPALTPFGYKGYFLKRTGSKSDGCAILFQHKKFKLIKFVPVDFQRGGLLDRDNIGIILLLKPNRKFYQGAVSKICVATTHLLFNPKRGDVKLAQLMLFLAEIGKQSILDNAAMSQTDQTASSTFPSGGSENEFKRTVKHPYCPVILCGDMNLEPNSSLYNFITKGSLRYDAHSRQELSGQREGSHKSSYLMSPKLLPEHLGINEDCQFIQQTSKHQEAQIPSTHNSILPENEKCLELEQVDKGDPQESNPSSHSSQTAASVENTVTSINTGRARHNFGFKSVYSYGSQHHRMVTTHHERGSCAVDYIFYSSGERVPNSIHSSEINYCDNESDVCKYGRKKRKISENGPSMQQCSSNPHKTLRVNAENPDLGDEVERDDAKNTISRISHDTSNQLYKCEVHTVESESDLPVIPQDALNNNSEPGDIGKGNVSSYHQLHNVKKENSDNEDVSVCSEMYSQDCHGEKSLEAVAYWSLLSNKQMKEYPSLPNHIFPSDHVCLIAKFLLH